MSTHARLMWQRDQPFDVTTINPHSRQYRPLLVLDLTPAANEARVEAVAKELFKHDGWSYGWKTCGVAPFRLIYLARARAALSALSPKLVNKEKTL